MWGPGVLWPSRRRTQRVFARAPSHSTRLQPSPSRKGGDGGHTRTSSGLTCTAGCLLSLLLGELSPVACCSRNWRATWRACKRDTARWAGGRPPSSSSSSRHAPPPAPRSSTQPWGQPDRFSMALIHGVREVHEEGSAPRSSLLPHQYDQYDPSHTTVLPRGPQGPRASPILFQNTLLHLQQVTRSSISVPLAGFHTGHPPPPHAPAPAQPSPGTTSTQPTVRRSGRLPAGLFHPCTEPPPPFCCSRHPFWLTLPRIFKFYICLSRWSTQQSWPPPRFGSGQGQDDTLN